MRKHMYNLLVAHAAKLPHAGLRMAHALLDCQEWYPYQADVAEMLEELLKAHPSAFWLDELLARSIEIVSCRAVYVGSRQDSCNKDSIPSCFAQASEGEQKMMVAGLYWPCKLMQMLAKEAQSTSLELPQAPGPIATGHSPPPVMPYAAEVEALESQIDEMMQQRSIEEYGREKWIFKIKIDDPTPEPAENRWLCGLACCCTWMAKKCCG